MLKCEKHGIHYTQGNGCITCQAESLGKLKACKHEWIDYNGFTDRYKYCQHCGEKK